MAKYVYPAIFTPEDNGQYSIRFPDIKNCFTGADSLPEAMDMANDVLCLMLYDMELAKKEVPSASPVADIQLQTEDGEFVTLIACDTDEYRRKNDNRAVKKTLSIPSWLNAQAERAGVNFSQVLQDALKEKLNVG